MKVWRSDVLTLFPDMFPGPLGMSLAGRGLREGKWSLEAHDIRRFGIGKHRSVDGSPAGGGPGMVLRVDVIAGALDHVVTVGDERPLLLLSARGRPLDQEQVRELVRGSGVVLLAGRFEGVDERLMMARNITEVSVGDFILSGGEIAAMALLDACVRLLPGVMGTPLSGMEESFEDDLLEYPQYTLPRSFEGFEVPRVLLSGDHGAIASWRREQAKEVTRERRADLWSRYVRGGRQGSPS